MDENEWILERFEEHRRHLRAVAYRMLGSLSEADDAVQETWLRLSRTDAAEVENLGGWLTTVTARVCLNMLRSRQTRREEPLGVHVPDPVVTPGERRRHRSRRRCWPTRSAWPCSSCWRCSRRRSGWRSCCTTCSPCRSTRSPPIVGRSPAATRQLASRARRRVQGATAPDSRHRPPARGRRRLLRRGARRRLRRPRGRARSRRGAALRRRHGAPGGDGGAAGCGGGGGPGADVLAPVALRASGAGQRRRRRRGGARGPRRCRSWGSPCAAARSWRSTPSPTPSGWRGST